jgi:hypothetical protein
LGMGTTRPSCRYSASALRSMLDERIGDFALTKKKRQLLVGTYNPELQK